MILTRGISEHDVENDKNAYQNNQCEYNDMPLLSGGIRRSLSFYQMFHIIESNAISLQFAHFEMI